MTARLGFAVLVLCTFGLSARGGEEVDWAKIDIGTHVVGEKVNASCVLSNPTSRALTIKRVQTSCSCTTAVPTKEVIPPGESATLNVAIDSLGRAGSFAGRIVVITDDASTPNRFVGISGYFRTLDSELTADPQRLSFARLEANVPVAQGAWITRHGKVPVGPVRLEVTAPWIQAAIDPTRGNEHRVFVKLVLRATEERPTVQRGELIVHGSGGQSDMIRLPVTVANTEPALVFPRRILVDEREAEYRLKVVPGAKELGRLKSVTTDNGSIEVSQCVEVDGADGALGTTRIRLRAKPIGSGFLHTELQMFFEGSTEPIRVELTGWKSP